MGLSKYKTKRNFQDTPEPVGHVGKKSKQLKFVIQRHAATRLHYDLRLEMEGVLKSWAIPKGPSMVAGEKRLAVMVEDHPIEYGDFFGEIPEGNYGAGVVDIFDKGTYKAYKATPTDDHEAILLQQLHKGDIKIDFNGTHIKGAFALVRLKNADGEANNWLLIKKNDDHNLDSFDIEATKPIIQSGLTKKKKSVKKTPLADPDRSNIIQEWENLKHPMLTTLVSKIQNKENWLYEVKYDGYRALAMVNNGNVEMVSRNGNSFTSQFKSLIEELNAFEEQIIIDGEIVIENSEGISDFQLLQNYISQKKGKLKYYVFDITYLNGHSLAKLPLKNRKELLDNLFQNYKFKNIINAPYTVSEGEELLAKLTNEGYEGIIAKDMDSPYLPGKRTNSWQKVKLTSSQEAIICGYTLPLNSRKYFGSLILGMIDNGNLKHVGNVGSGFTDKTLKEVYNKLQDIRTNTKPFELKTRTTLRGKPIWVEPKYLCNVKFQAWTHDRIMRAPVFLGLRSDKSPDEVELQSALPMENEDTNVNERILKIGRKNVKLTNLNKIFWPDEGITKGDLINYYQSISNYILPYLKNRPQSLNRFPNGIKGPSFYQKDMEVSQLPDWVKTVKIYSKANDKEIDYLICNDTATLLFMANLGCIEINPWHSTYMNEELPDYMMLDLDPGDISFTEVVNTALVVKELCDELKVNSFCKTSGATGLHIYIPLGAKYDYDQVKSFAEILATITQSRIPEVTTIERTVAKRGNKIYVDFLQNRKGQTIAAPYSVRPRSGATVSTPLNWSEVNHTLHPSNFHMGNIIQRLDKTGDLWKGVLSKPIDMLKVLNKLDKLK